MRHVRISSILAVIAVVMMMVSFTTVALAQQAGQSFEAEAQEGQSLSSQPQPTPSPTPQPAPGPAPQPGQSFEARAQAGQTVGGQPQPGPGPAPQPPQSPPAGSQPPPAGSQPPPPPPPPSTNEFRNSGLIVNKIAYASDGPPQRPEASASGFGFIAIEVDGSSCNSPVPGGDQVTAVEVDNNDLKSYSSYQFIAGTANGLLISTYYCLYETDTVNSEGRIFRPFDPVYTTGYLFFSGPYPGYTSTFQVVNNEVP